MGVKSFLPRPDAREDRDRKLRNACKEFESLFTYQLLQSMRRTVQKCDLFHGGGEEDMYESLLDQELSKSLAGQGNRGLADVLYRQLSREDAASLNTDFAPGSLREPQAPCWPLQGRVSSEFGWRVDPIHGREKFHQGLDLAAAEGTPVRSCMPGRVVLSDYRDGYGNVVVVDHGNGFTTLYAHNRENLASEGDRVSAGDPLARLGSTGRSTGPHLHFEVRRHGRHMDPAEFLDGSPESRFAEPSAADFSPNAG